MLAKVKAFVRFSILFEKETIATQAIQELFSRHVRIEGKFSFRDVFLLIIRLNIIYCLL